MQCAPKFMFLIAGFYQATTEVHNFMWRVTAVIRPLTDLTSLHSFENLFSMSVDSFKCFIFSDELTRTGFVNESLKKESYRQFHYLHFITPVIWKWLPILEDQVAYITPKFLFCFKVHLLYKHSIIKANKIKGIEKSRLQWKMFARGLHRKWIFGDRRSRR